MEFILNKIDPEVRKRVRETTSSGKVHTKSGIVINKDNKKNNKDHSQGEFDSELKKYKNGSNKKFFVKAVKVIEVEVPAYKVIEVEVPAYKEEIEGFSESEKRGHIIDVRK